MEQVGENLRRLRKMRGLTQEDLEAESGVAQDSISQIELGKREPHGRTLRRLAGALGVPVSALFEEAQPEVVDLAREGFAGAEAAVEGADPDERANLVEEDRELLFDAIMEWRDARTQTNWWLVQMRTGRWGAVRRAVDGGDYLGVLSDLNEVWRQAHEGQRQ